MIARRKHWQTLSELKCGKPVKILVWKNGDFYGSGQEITLNPFYLITWNTILNYLTEILQPNFGAVRKLIHVETKMKVDRFKDLKPLDRYVAVGINMFKYRKWAYGAEPKKLYFPKADKRKAEKPYDLNDSILDFMETTQKNHRKVIYVMLSGRIHQEATKVVLTELDLAHWNVTLKYLGKILDVPEGVEYVCKPAGDVIEDPDELEHGGLYVAVPFMEKFARKDYMALFRQQMSVKRSKPYTVLKKKPKVSVKLKRKSKKEMEFKQCISNKCFTEECRIEGAAKKTFKVEPVGFANQDEFDTKEIEKFVDDLITECIDKLERQRISSTFMKKPSGTGLESQLGHDSFLDNFEYTKPQENEDKKIYMTFAEMAQINQAAKRNSSELDLSRGSSVYKKSVAFNGPIYFASNEASIFEVKNPTIPEEILDIPDENQNYRNNRFSSVKNSLSLPRSEALLSNANLTTTSFETNEYNDSNTENVNRDQSDSVVPIENIVQINITDSIMQNGISHEKVRDGVEEKEIRQSTEDLSSTENKRKITSNEEIPNSAFPITKKSNLMPEMQNGFSREELHDGAEEKEIMQSTENLSSIENKSKITSNEELPNSALTITKKSNLMPEMQNGFSHEELHDGEKEKEIMQSTENLSSIENKSKITSNEELPNSALTITKKSNLMPEMQNDFSREELHDGADEKEIMQSTEDLSSTENRSKITSNEEFPNSALTITKKSNLKSTTNGLRENSLQNIFKNSTIRHGSFESQVHFEENSKDHIAAKVLTDIPEVSSEIAQQAEELKSSEHIAVKNLSVPGNNMPSSSRDLNSSEKITNKKSKSILSTDKSKGTSTSTNTNTIINTSTIFNTFTRKKKSSDSNVIKTSGILSSPKKSLSLTDKNVTSKSDDLKSSENITKEKSESISSVDKSESTSASTTSSTSGKLSTSTNTSSDFIVIDETGSLTSSKKSVESKTDENVVSKKVDSFCQASESDEKLRNSCTEHGLDNAVWNWSKENCISFACSEVCIRFSKK